MKAAGEKTGPASPELKAMAERIKAEQEKKPEAAPAPMKPEPVPVNEPSPEAVPPAGDIEFMFMAVTGELYDMIKRLDGKMTDLSVTPYKACALCKIEKKSYVIHFEEVSEK